MTERLLVVAPHPDDESLGAGGLMARARRRGSEVYVVLLTLGDGFAEDAARYYLSLDVKPEEYLHMGYERHREAVRALEEVGVPKDHIFFLGFPDGGLDALWRTHWDGLAWTSTTTHFDHVPYIDAWRSGVPYLGVRLSELLGEIFAMVAPDVLIMPSAFDTHPDHWAANAFATLAWSRLAQTSEHWRAMPRWGYLVHWPTWPFPLSYRPRELFQAPVALVDLRQESWRSEALEPVEVEQKRRALMAHESQTELIKPFMLAFCRRTEMFAEEESFQTIPDRGGCLVANPRAGWRTRLVQRTPLLTGVRWGRQGAHDFAEIMMRETVLPPDAQWEVSLHRVGDPVWHGQWMTDDDAAPEGVEWRLGRGQVTVSWPREWLGDESWVMAGVQIHVHGKCEGKIPFRLLGWPR